MRSSISRAAIGLLAAAAASAALGQEPTPTPPAAPTPAPTPAPPAEPPSTTPPPTASSATYFNPAIAVIGNFLGFVGHNPVDDQPSLQLAESEISLQAAVDPYARADFFLSFSNDDVE